MNLASISTCANAKCNDAYFTSCSDTNYCSKRCEESDDRFEERISELEEQLSEVKEQLSEVEEQLSEVKESMLELTRKLTISLSQKCEYKLMAVCDRDTLSSVEVWRCSNGSDCFEPTSS